MTRIQYAVFHLKDEIDIHRFQAKKLNPEVAEESFDAVIDQKECCTVNMISQHTAGQLLSDPFESAPPPPPPIIFKGPIQPYPRTESCRT